MGTPATYKLTATRHVNMFCIMKRQRKKTNRAILLFGQRAIKFDVSGLALEPLDEGSNTGVDFLHPRSPLSPRLAGALLGLAIAGLGRTLALLARGVPGTCACFYLPLCCDTIWKPGDYQVLFIYNNKKQLSP